MSLEEMTMNFWQRALKSVTRRKGKSFILFLVIFILGNVIAGAVAVQQSTMNVERETKKKMGNIATVEFDYEQFEKDNEGKSDEERYSEDNYPKPPTTEDYDKAGKLDYVKYYDYTMIGWLETKKFKAYTPEDESFGMAGGNYFSVKGGNRLQPLDMEEGNIKLIEGEIFSEKDLSEATGSVLISKEVAEKNNLSVGDQVVLDMRSEMYNDVSVDDSGEGTEADESTEADDLEQSTSQVVTADYPVKIAGIFSVVKKESDNSNASQEEKANQIWQAVDQINTVYATNQLVKDLNKVQTEKMWGGTEADTSEQEYYQAMYVLNSTDDVEAFKQEANPLLPDYYQVVASTDQYEQIAGGMNRLGTISRYIVIIAAIATVFIISLVVLLFLRDRKQELGIYLSLGEGRGKVIGQIVIEVVLVSLLALICSLVTGNLLGGAVSNTLMQSDWMTNLSQTDTYYSSAMMSSTLSYSDIQSAYKVTFSVGYIVTYLLLGLGTVLLSAILPLLYILRLNPKKIMM
jgi:putative ABC transport system permease protein